MSPLQSGDPEEEQRLVTLMGAYQDGDLGAFERLYAALAPHLRRYFCKVFRDLSSVDDLMQETFLEMHRSRRTYAAPLPVRPWAFGVARNVLARRRRAARLQQQHAQLAADGHEAASVSACGSEVIDIEHALAALPAKNRDSWLLHHLFGFNFDSIAAQLGITVVAAKLRSSRATRALRIALAGKREAL